MALTEKEKSQIISVEGLIASLSGLFQSFVDNILKPYFVLKRSLSSVATSGSYNDLQDKPTIPTVPTNVSTFTNDSGYITGITKAMVTNALGYTPPTTNTWQAANASQVGYVPKSTANKILRADSSGNLYWGDDIDTNTNIITSVVGQTGAVTAAQIGAALTSAGYKLTDTNTWRGIQDNLTSSTNTTESLSAKQGYLLANGSARDNTKLPLSGGTITGGYGALKIKRSDNDYSAIAFYGSSDTLLGYIGVDPSKQPTFAMNANTIRTIWHSGNLTKVSQLTNDSGYTTNTGTVTQVKVGSTAYNPNSGVVSLPAYPSVPTKTSQLTNDSGFLHSITSSMVTGALGYTPTKKGWETPATGNAYKLTETGWYRVATLKTYTTAVVRIGSNFYSGLPNGTFIALYSGSDTVGSGIVELFRNYSNVPHITKVRITFDDSNMYLEFYCNSINNIEYFDSFGSIDFYDTPIKVDDESGLTVNVEIPLTPIPSGRVLTDGNIKQSYTEISSNTNNISCSLSYDGCETRLFYNSGSSKVTVSIATSNHVAVDGTGLSLECPAGGYLEVSFMKIGSTVYVRSATSF